MTWRTCQRCGSQFPFEGGKRGRPPRFCGPVCAGKPVHKGTEVDGKCARCGADFRYVKQYKRRKYCSPACERPGSYGKAIATTCLCCKRPFTYIRKRKPRVYCDTLCARAGNYGWSRKEMMEWTEGLEKGMKMCAICGAWKNRSEFPKSDGKAQNRRKECIPCWERMERPATQRCFVCKKDLPLSEFYPAKDRRFGVRRDCKACVRDRIANGKRTVEQVKGYALKHKVKQYGLVVDDYSAMILAQGGKCAACGDHTDECGTLAIDHCHLTGKVRGLLCTRCNLTLGQVEDASVGLILYAMHHSALPAVRVAYAMGSTTQVVNSNEVTGKCATLLDFSIGNASRN